MSRDKSKVKCKNICLECRDDMKKAEAYKAKDIAHYIVNKCYNQEEPISNLHLQKILYFIQLTFASLYNKLLFDDEFEAWPYGPVIRSIYIEYSQYGGSPIRRKYDTNMVFKNKGDQVFVDVGIEVLREKSPWDLVKISHAMNSPWDKIYNQEQSPKAPIPNNLILDAAKAIRNQNEQE